MQILLMGRSGSGKTSMRSIVFANFTSSETYRLGATVEVEQSNYFFSPDTFLDVWDCGGQDVFVKGYFENSYNHMFSNVCCVVYVFDVASDDTERELKYFFAIWNRIKRYSKDAKMFCLLHKMDLIPQSKRELVFDCKKRKLADFFEKTNRALSENSSSMNGAVLPLAECAKEELHDVIFFATTIWDESVYSAWSNIVSIALKSVVVFLKSICETVFNVYEDSLREIAVFDRNSLLLLFQMVNEGAAVRLTKDYQKFVEVTNMLKILLKNCRKIKKEFLKLEHINRPSESCSSLEEISVSASNKWIFFISTTDKKVNEHISRDIKTLLDTKYPQFYQQDKLE